MSSHSRETSPEGFSKAVPHLAPLAEADELSRSVELALAAKEGDRDALSELLERYEQRVYRIARIRMGARIRRILAGLFDSGDIVQNAYIVAMRKIRDLELESHASIIQWLSRIVQNQVRDALDYAQAERRAKDREVPIDQLSAGADPIDLVARAPRPLDIVSDTELGEIYDHCVEALDHDLREVILLREYSGGSWEFIARELGRPSAHATEELYRRARRALIPHLRKYLAF